MAKQAAGADGALGYFRSTDFPVRDRFSTWRHFTETLYPGSSTRRAQEDEPFEWSIRYRSLSDMHLMWGPLGATLNTRPRSDDNDDFSLFINLQGKALARQRGHEFELGIGDAYLMAHSERGSLDRSTAGEMVSVRVSAQAVAPFLSQAYDCVGCTIPWHAEGLRLLARYVRMLDEAEPSWTERERALVATHVLDLLALALGATRDLRERAGRRGGRAVLLKAVTSYVERSASGAALSVDAVARRFSVSPRTLQRLFREEGTTFTDVLSEKRLLLAHRLLTSPRFERVRVGDIALTAGFGDLSYFNRSFRRRFGLTPSDVRTHRSADSRAAVPGLFNTISR